MKSTAWVPPVCASVDIAYENDRGYPDDCAKHITRETARKFLGLWWCRRCLIREFQKHRNHQAERFLELTRQALWHPADMSTAECMELLQFIAREKRRKQHRREYARKWRRGELSWQRTQQRIAAESAVKGRPKAA